MVNIKVQYPKWADACLSWANYSGEPLLQVIQDETRGVLERATKFTAPQGGESQGKRAVEADIRRLFKTEKNFKSGLFENKGKRSVGGRFRTLLYANSAWASSPVKTSRALNAIAKNVGLPKIRIASGRTIYKEHEAHRTKKNRRTASRGGSEIVITPDATLSDYIKRRQKKVGLHRGGWAVAGQRLSMSFPDYIAKNARFGSYKEHSKGDIVGVEVGNKSPGIVDQDKETQILGQAVSARARDIEKRLRMAIKGTLDSLATPGKRFTGRMVGGSTR